MTLTLRQKIDVYKAYRKLGELHRKRGMKWILHSKTFYIGVAAILGYLGTYMSGEITSQVLIGLLIREAVGLANRLVTEAPVSLLPPKKDVP